MKLNRMDISICLGILLYGSLFLLPLIGSVNIFDWDEIIFAESSGEMLLSGDYMKVSTGYSPVWEKPQLFFWIQSFSVRIFGDGEFAARFPNVICGMITLLALYRIGRRILGNRFGLFWAISYATAILPYIYFRTGVIDPWLNLFMMLGFSWFIFFLNPENQKRRTINVALSALFFGLAFLAKGPVTLLIFVICLLLFLALKKNRIAVSLWHVVTFISVLVLTTGIWYIPQLLKGNTEVISAFIKNQATLFSMDDTGHGGFPGFHFVILFLGVFPASILFLTSITKKLEVTNLQQLFRQWMYILLGLVVVLFSVVETKLVHYSSLAYFPITFLAAWVWDKWVDRRLEIRGWQLILISAVSLFYSVGAILVPLLNTHTWLIPKAELARYPMFWEQALQSEIHWSGMEFVIGIILISGVLYSIWLIRKREMKGMYLLHIVILVYSSVMISVYTPKIEYITHGAAVEFCETHQDENAYIASLGYRSYKSRYYGRGEENTHLGFENFEELIHSIPQGKIYIIMKLDDKQKFLDRFPQLNILYERNGFVFTQYPTQ